MNKPVKEYSYRLWRLTHRGTTHQQKHQKVRLSYYYTDINSNKCDTKCDTQVIQTKTRVALGFFWLISKCKQCCQSQRICMDD